MSTTRQRSILEREIMRQKSIEPEQCEDEILLGFLSLIETRTQWDEFVICKHYRYGKMSYETHRFYYPSPALKEFIRWAKGLKIEI